jgi:hypothetical protein
LQQYVGDESAVSPPQARPCTFLDELGQKHKPTKRAHDYLKHYHLHFHEVRMRVQAVLEIGVDSGRSLAMWEEYFPNAAIHGIDIDARCKESEGGRRKIHIGNAADPQFLAGVVGTMPNGFDIVIDDGSHQMEDQLRSFDYLFPRLTGHGVYVIEDTGACVGDFGSRTINRLAKLIEHINYWPSTMPCPWPPDMQTVAPRNWVSQFPGRGHWADRHITGISFYRWIVFVQRGLNPEDNPCFRGEWI